MSDRKYRHRGYQDSGGFGSNSGGSSQRPPQTPREFPIPRLEDAPRGRTAGGFGPDAVGSHPASASPYGVMDMSGNVWELLRTANHDGFVMRGGGYFTGTNSSNLANRQPITATFQHLHAGLRICADP